MPTTLTPSTDELRIYECTVLLPVSLSDKEYNQAQKDVEALFEEKRGKLLHKDEWGRMGLAYKIKGNTEGRYILYYYELAPEHVSDINQSIRLEKGILRHLLITVPDNYEVQDWAAHFVSWKEERTKREETQAAEKEEKLKQKIVSRVARKTTGTAAEPAKEKKKEAVEEKELEAKLDQLISDEDLNL